FPCRRFGRVDLARGFKGARHFDAEVDFHGRAGTRRMVVEEDVVSVGAQSRLASHEVPDQIQCRTPGLAGLAERHPPARGGEFARVNSLNGDCWHSLRIAALLPEQSFSVWHIAGP